MSSRNDRTLAVCLVNSAPTAATASQSCTFASRREATGIRL
ncbi:MAG TPA: hypothetical protein VGJ95_01705 [Pseudonocardiaceae bacterium]